MIHEDLPRYEEQSENVCCAAQWCMEVVVRRGMDGQHSLSPPKLEFVGPGGQEPQFFHGIQSASPEE